MLWGTVTLSPRNHLPTTEVYLTTLITLIMIEDNEGHTIYCDVHLNYILSQKNKSCEICKFKENCWEGDQL